MIGGTVTETRSSAGIEIGGGDTARPRNLAKRIGLIRKHCRLVGSAVLDCGCGEGEYVMAMVKEGADARGVEFEREKVAAFEARFPGSHRVRQGDIQRLGFSDNSFDLVLLNEVLEHIPNQDRALAETRRVLRPGGKLALFSPNRLYPFETHGVYIKGSADRLPHYTPFVPYIPVPLGRRFFRYWARNYWPWELRRMIRDAGFDIIAKTYIWQTFEDISGNQPRVLTLVAPVLRRVATLLEKTPGARVLGASQVVIAQPRG